MSRCSSGLCIWDGYFYLARSSCAFPLPYPAISRYQNWTAG